MKGRKLNLICVISMALLLNFSIAEVYRCSKNEENCVFPFDYDGNAYNECTTEGSSMGYPWCKTDGSYGWSYCEICEEDKTTSTTTTTSATTTTTATTTTVALETTSKPAPATIKATTKPTTAAIKATSKPVKAAIKATSRPTTAELARSPRKQSTPSIMEIEASPQKSTTMTAKPRASITQKSPVNSTKTEYVSRAAMKSTTQPSKKTTRTPTTTKSTTARALPVVLARLMEATEDVEKEAEVTSSDEKTARLNIVLHTTESEKEEDFDAATASVEESVLEVTTSKSVTKTAVKTTSTTTSTVEPTTAEACTKSRKRCELPFEYGGVMYYGCVSSYLYSWGWCYTDSSIEEYSPCVPCEESTTSSTVATTTTTGAKKIGGSLVPRQRKQTVTESTRLKASTRFSTVSASTTGVPLSKSGVPLSKSGVSLSKSGVPLPTAGLPLPTAGKQKILATNVTTHESTDPGDLKRDSPSTVTIIVLTLCIVAAVVILLMGVLYVMRLRKSKKADKDMKADAGEFGEGLLSNRSDENFKSANDGDSQEMKLLNSKPEVGPGGDCGSNLQLGGMDTVNVIV